LERARSYTRHNEASALGHARREGEAKGIAKGIAKGKEEVARNALAQGVSPELIHTITGLDIETINSIQLNL
jgi:predicted transposase/invertase (TIGR01784 family)